MTEPKSQLLRLVCGEEPLPDKSSSLVTPVGSSKGIRIHFGFDLSFDSHFLNAALFWVKLPMKMVGTTQYLSLFPFWYSSSS